MLVRDAGFADPPCGELSVDRRRCYACVTRIDIVLAGYSECR